MPIHKSTGGDGGGGDGGLATNSGNNVPSWRIVVMLGKQADHGTVNTGGGGGAGSKAAGGSPYGGGGGSWCCYFKSAYSLITLAQYQAPRLLQQTAILRLSNLQVLELIRVKYGTFCKIRIRITKLYK